MATATVRFPSIKDVATELRDAKRWCEPANDNEVEVRLQVTDDGNWGVHTGSPQYDTDHHGYWGAGTVTPKTNTCELARDLIEQAKDDYAEENPA
jgi:hypothetical protein